MFLWNGDGYAPRISCTSGLHQHIGRSNSCILGSRRRTGREGKNKFDDSPLPASPDAALNIDHRPLGPVGSEAKFAEEKCYRYIFDLGLSIVLCVETRSRAAALSERFDRTQQRKRKTIFLSMYIRTGIHRHPGCGSRSLGLCGASPPRPDVRCAVATIKTEAETPPTNGADEQLVRDGT